jgi:hypothetical protein
VNSATTVAAINPTSPVSRLFALLVYKDLRPRPHLLEPIFPPLSNRFFGLLHRHSPPSPGRQGQPRQDLLRSALTSFVTRILEIQGSPRTIGNRTSPPPESSRRADRRAVFPSRHRPSKARAGVSGPHIRAPHVPLSEVTHLPSPTVSRNTIPAMAPPQTPSPRLPCIKSNELKES